MIKVWKCELPRNKTLRYGVRWIDDTCTLTQQRGFASEQERREFMARLTLGLADADLTPGTFGEAVHRVIARKRSPRTRETYRYTLPHLKPIMGWTVAEVASDRDAVADLVAHNAQGKRMLLLIRETCEHSPGYSLGGKFTVGRPSKRATNYYDATPDQIAQLAGKMGPKAIIVWCMALAGLRAGEALALRPDDFSKNGTLRVERQRDRTGGGTSPLKGCAEGESRTVVVDPVLSERVAEHIATYGQGDFCTTCYQTFMVQFRVWA
jgi:integrase